MSGWIVKRGTLERPVADIATLIRLAQDHRLKSSDLIFHPDRQEWQNASDVPEISHAFSDRVEDVPPATFEASVSPPQVTTTTQLATPPPVAPSVPAVETVWGSATRIVGVVGGAVAIFGGITLLGLKAAGESSLIEALAHGIGIYCIGRGLFMIAATGNFKAAVDFLARRIGSG
jgi:hypothetical protein